MIETGPGNSYLQILKENAEMIDSAVVKAGYLSENHKRRRKQGTRAASKMKNDLAQLPNRLIHC
jgi:hypothetical protein